MIKVTAGNMHLPHSSKIFSGGEVHVKLLPSNAEVDKYFYFGNPVSIHACVKSPADLLELIMLTNAIRNRYKNPIINLTLPYVPYARQDRVCDVGEALSIKVFADLINSQKYKQVTVWDPHSDVTTALIDNCHVVEQWSFIDKIVNLLGSDIILVSPDAGALKKVNKAANVYNIKDVVRADKTRDPFTGAIGDTIVYSGNVGKRDFLILDDICDGGRTFNELAKVLRPLTTGNINLFVTHGIFSWGFEELKKHIDHIWVANCFIDIPNEYNSFVSPGASPLVFSRNLNLNSL